MILLDIEMLAPAAYPLVHPDDPHPVEPLGNDGAVTVQLVDPLGIVHDLVLPLKFAATVFALEGGVASSTQSSRLVAPNF